MPFACQTDRNQMLGKGLLRLPPFYAKSCSSICQRSSDLHYRWRIGVTVHTPVPFRALYYRFSLFLDGSFRCFYFSRGTQMPDVASSANRLGTFSSHPQWEVSVHPACRRNTRSKTRLLHSPIPEKGASNPLPQLVWDQTTASSFECAIDSVYSNASSRTHLLISIYAVTLCIQRIYSIFLSK